MIENMNLITIFKSLLFEHGYLCNNISFSSEISTNNILLDSYNLFISTKDKLGPKSKTLFPAVGCHKYTSQHISVCIISLDSSYVSSFI